MVGLIGLCLMPTLAVFQVYREHIIQLSNSTTRPVEIKYICVENNRVLCTNKRIK
jgi:hypothetical protein